MADELPEEDVSQFVRVVLTDAEREVLQEEYDNAGETRNTDILIRWMMAAVMFPLNTALLLFALDRVLKGERFVSIVISFAAIIYVFLWYRLEGRMEGLIQYWISKLIRLEDFLDPILRVFGGPDYRRDVVVRRGRRTHGILLTMIRFFGVIGISMMVFGSLYTPPQKKPAVEEDVLIRIQQIEEKFTELQKQIVLLQQPPPRLIPEKITPQPKKRGKRR